MARPSLRCLAVRISILTRLLWAASLWLALWLGLGLMGVAAAFVFSEALKRSPCTGCAADT